MEIYERIAATNLGKRFKACMGLHVGVFATATLAANIFAMSLSRSARPLRYLPASIVMGVFASGAIFLKGYFAELGGIDFPSIEACEKINQQLKSWLHIEGGQVSATFSDPHTGETIKVRCLAETDPSNTTTGIKILENTCTIIDSR